MVRVDEAGDVSVQMFLERESLQTEYPLHLGLIRFFGGDEFVQEHASRVSTTNPFAQNPRTGLEVATPHGTLCTADVDQYVTSSVINTGDVTEANFAVGLSAFDAHGAGVPDYWVLPLANFLSECRQAHSDFNNHPLCIFPTPELGSRR